MGVGKGAHTCEHVRHRKLHRGDRIGRGHVHDDDTPLAAPFDIDIVDTYPGTHQSFQIGCGVDERFVDFRRTSSDRHIGFAYDIEQLVFGHVSHVDILDIRLRRKHFKTAFMNVVTYHDYMLFHPIPLCSFLFRCQYRIFGPFLQSDPGSLCRDCE